MGTRGGGPRDGVSDQVGERHLAGVAAGGERAAELAPAAVEHVDPDASERRRGGNVATALHVVHEGRGRALDRLGVFAVDDPRGRVVSRTTVGLGAEHVCLGHDAAGARSVYGAKIDAVPGGGPARERRGIDIGAVRRSAGCGCGRDRLGAWRRLRGGYVFRAGRRRRGSLSLRLLCRLGRLDLWLRCGGQR